MTTGLPELTEATIRQYASAGAFERGWQYYRQGAVLALTQRGTLLQAEVEGSEPVPYQVRVTCDAGGVAEASCTCPYDYGGWCKHVVAALLAAMSEPETIVERPDLATVLASLDREQLQTLLLTLAERDPALADAIEARATLLTAQPEPATTPAASAARQRRTPLDTSAIRRQVHASLQGLDRLPASRAYWQVGGVVGEVGSVLDQAWDFIKAGDGRNALAILEAITEEYRMGWDYLDDSNGEVSGFYFELGPAWTEALLSAELTAEERAEWGEKLAGWQDELDQYGVEEAFATAQLAAEQGWDEPRLRRILRGEFATEEIRRRVPPSDDSFALPYGYYDRYRDPEEALTRAYLNVLERQGRADEYLNLARAEGEVERYTVMLARLGRVAEAVAYGLDHLGTAAEVLALATALRERGELAPALQIGERGLSLAGPRASLATWLRDVAAAAGRTDLALRAALVGCHEERSLTAYRRVQELAGDEWPARREELLADLRQTPGYLPQGPVDIFLHEGLLDDAIALVDRSGSHSLIEQVADAALASRPDWVIRASRKQAEAIMNQGKSQHYDTAARWLAKARAAYLVADRAGDWQAYRDDLLSQHARKYKLVPLLEALE